MDSKVSIIIPAWNGEAFLEACLASVLEQLRPGDEIIVVDNASSDHSAEIAGRFGPPISLIRSETNRGFSGGCNLGLRAAKGDLLVLLNQDTRAAPGWLEAVGEAFRVQAEAGIVGGKALYPETRKIQHAGGWLERPLGFAHHFGYGEDDQGQWDAPRPVEFVTGAALALRRATLERIGLLDEDFWPGYFEDLDYCWRAKAAGLGVWYWPAAVVWHHESASTDSVERSRFYQRGRLRFMLKHVPPPQLLSEFVPAEEAAQFAAIGGGESRPLRLAYLEMILDLPGIFQRSWQAAPDVVQAALAAFNRLYLQAGQTDLRRLKGADEPAIVPPEPLASMPANHSDSSAATMWNNAQDLTPAYVQLVETRRPGAPPSEENRLGFKEYHFRSSVPVAGPLIARLRRWSYGLAARWAMLYVMQQQEAINRQQAATNQRLDTNSRATIQWLQDLAEENALLAARLAKAKPSSDDRGEQP